MHGKAHKGIAMEGPIATWYANNTGKSLEFREDAARIARRLRAGAVVLEIAPGPGFLAIELAKLGYRVRAVDVSRSFVRIATENAARANVAVEFRHGNASDLPYEGSAFDFVVCRAALKNFADPTGALREMHRVLKPGGTALIIDMRRDATDADIADETAKLNVGPWSRVVTRVTLRSLRRRAYSRADIERMLAEVPFSRVLVEERGIGFEASLTK
jgi:ubiquinone/menaquinone biosynthesis C-methylase UbiE